MIADRRKNKWRLIATSGVGLTMVFPVLVFADHIVVVVVVSTDFEPLCH